MKKFAVVLGASGEIGEKIARQLADSKWSVYLHWNSRPLDDLAAELKAGYPDQEFVPVRADFAENGAAERLAGQVFDAACIVVASGHALYKMLIDTTDPDIEELWQVHVKNPVSAIRLISPFFHRHSKSYVVFISSIWGEIGASMETAYSAVKGAQLAFVKAYAKEMAASGTRVNAVSPGFIATKMNSSWSEEELKAIEDEIPLGLGTPQDVADAVDFLVNGKADYMTGQTLRVNGGWHM
ncbi:elongation factor P 5-aminopentanone reductase [Planomicrobium sp. CPCC 101110]|uniref:elongation factor P 5-aminopentanone reductase n=1 Tax=Planomicrobium sp. CPCC 101110 TaxID=2599619 RepID=UPI0011B6AF0E|nr:SDR family oxidoreductase [Planomicrobium sp. CPCC 101110]TWT28213.1 SDR family oxidoreductase [Planomicrobium sp. CPCC 101110]